MRAADKHLSTATTSAPKTVLETEYDEIMCMLLGVQHIFAENRGHPSARLTEMAETIFCDSLPAADGLSKAYDTEYLLAGALAQVGDNYTAQVFLTALVSKVAKFGAALDLEDIDAADVKDPSAPVRAPAPKASRPKRARARSEAVAA